jgi:hypothetical protein
MKLRLDLLKHLTTEDVMEDAVAVTTVHRFKPEPLFSQTGTGSLSPASTQERTREEAHSMELIQRLEERARKSGQHDPKK